MPQPADYWDPRNPVQKADRLRFHQRRRWVCGLHLSSDLRQIHGCLLQGQGAGKRLQVAPLHVESIDIPDSILHLLAQSTCDFQDPTSDFKHLSPTLPCDFHGDLATLQAIQSDLSLLAERLLQQLMCAAGQASDQILAACLLDPGVRVAREHSRRIYPLLDAEAISFGTGMNVIDQLPSKDLLAGGQGWPLSAIPLWMMWGDRRHPVATETRLIVELNPNLVATRLPPSDGLDSEFPEIQQVWVPGLNAVATTPAPDANPADNTGPVSRETTSETVQRWWNWLYPAVVPMQFDRQTELHSVAKKIRTDRDGYCRHRPILSLWLRAIETLLQDSPEQGALIVVLAQPPWEARLQAALREHFPQHQVRSAGDFDCSVPHHGSLIAATHGFLHIDQMPCNLPWITGTDIPRILGRMIPGTPSRYRNLLVEMSDYRPPVMKLRDAV